MNRTLNKYKKKLYVGLDASRISKNVYHLPLIKILPRFFEVESYDQVSHILFTSRSAIPIFLEHYSLQSKELIAIGPGTAQKLIECGYRAAHIANLHTAEGVIQLLEHLTIAHLLLPHAAKARPLLPTYLKERGHLAIPIYDTELIYYESPPSLDLFDEIIFTSPSTVEAFINLYGSLPLKKTLTSIGPITQKSIELALIKKY